MHSSDEKNPAQEIVTYREQSLRASALGKKELAICWRLAADEALQFLRQKKQPTILLPQKSPFLAQVALLIHSNQEGNYYLNKQLQKQAPHWVFARDENREAGSAYRYWVALTQAGTSKNLEQEISRAREAATYYQATAPEASEAAKKTALFFEKAQYHQERLTHNNSIDHAFVIHRWKRAAYEAAHVAALHAHLATGAIENNEDWKNLLSLEKQALALRVKAAEATEKSHEAIAIEYSLAGYAISNAIESLLTSIARSEHISEKEKALSLTLTTQIASYRVKKSEILSSNPGAAILWDGAAILLETAWEAQCELLETKKKNTHLLSFYWEKSCTASEQAAFFLAKAASSTTRFPLLFHFCGKGMGPLLERWSRKKIPTAFFEKISFCLTETFLPIYEWRKAWEAGRAVPFDERSKSPTVTSWIYQTWSFLQQAGVDSILSTEFPSIQSTGIFITMTKLLDPALRRLPSSTSLFLVDILADGSPHPAANLHLVENRAYASYLPASLFMPHWPQPFLIPRDPARGMRFENICFFGEMQNLAPELRSKEWQERLHRELGLHFKIREPKEWHNYSDIDAVVAIRDFSRSRHFQKPATKLYNAWLAGVPFIGGRDAAFSADGTPGKDYLIATSVEELFQHLKELQEEPAYRARLVEEGNHSGRAFTKEATVEKWKQLIEETLPVRTVEWQQRSALKRWCCVWIQRVTCWLHVHWLESKLS